MNNNLEQKKQQLLDKYKVLFIQKTGLNGAALDSYVNGLIAIGEKHYGPDFVERILRTEKEDVILWLIDEMSKHSGAYMANNQNTVNNGILNQEEVVKGQMLANAFEAVAKDKAEKQAVDNLVNTINGDIPKRLEEGSTIDTNQILLEIDKMDEYGFNEYLKQLVLSQEQIIKFNKLISGAKQLNPHLSQFEAAKLSLKSMANEITLVIPNNRKKEYNNVRSAATIESRQSEERKFSPTPRKVEREKKFSPTPRKVEREQKFSPTPRKAKRKAAPQSLINKFKEKWNNTSFKKKVLIGAVAVGTVIGIGFIAAAAISQIITTQSFDANIIANANHLASNIINGSGVNSIDTNAGVDWSSIGPGTEVHSTLNDALNDANAQISNANMNVDHMEAVNTARDIVNLDGMSANEVNQVLDNGEYGVRGSSNGTFMGWFDEDTVREAVNNQGKVL